MEAKTVDAKYIFMDIVNYSQNRTVEAQTEIIEILNKIVLDVLSEGQISEENKILLPTGDGICIALLNLNDPFDLHINIAKNIILRLTEHNLFTIDDMKKFNVRIGINENTDNLITDINGHKNIAGSGINIAQRIMSFGDEAHILVSDSVFTRLSQREIYYQKFASYKAIIKHNVELNVYQLIDKDFFYHTISDVFCIINNSVPKAFLKQDKVEQKFSKCIAYYIGCLLKYSDFISSNIGPGIKNYALFILMEFLASDALKKSYTNKFSPFESRLPRETLDENLKYFSEIHFDVLCNYKDMFFETYVNRFWGEKYLSYDTYLLEINKIGIHKFFTEWPEIADQLGLAKEKYLGK